MHVNQKTIAATNSGMENFSTLSQLSFQTIPAPKKNNIVNVTSIFCGSGNLFPNNPPARLRANSIYNPFFLEKNRNTIRPITLIQKSDTKNHKDLRDGYPQTLTPELQISAIKILRIISTSE